MVQESGPQNLCNVAFKKIDNNNIIIEELRSEPINRLGSEFGRFCTCRPSRDKPDIYLVNFRYCFLGF